ncbi:Lar family restriction alleviation protein [Sphingobium yanoikuyae]|uniref:Lar family restriction alleviation protein n=1 Tax=Sphingobium yanoikuyae TaxID=13690 RepID=UPI0035C74919
MTKPNEPEGLEPCPFCQGPARAFQDRTWHRIQCVNCGAVGASSNRPEKTAKMWNRRFPAQPVADAGWVTEADRELHMWLTGYPLDDGDSETVRRVVDHRLQSVAAATAAKDAEIDRLREALTYFANRPTVAEVIEGKHDPMPDTVEARIEEMGRRKREHDEAILQARAALSEAREAGALANDSAPS